jgi:hypothetical protein
VRIHRGFLNWGVFFILLGAIPLAVQANAIDRSVVARSWQLWPLLIVAGGVGLLLRRTAFDFVGGLVAAATVGLMLGGLLAVGSDFTALGRACGGDAGSAFPSPGGVLGDGTVNLEFTCGDLTVDTAAGTGWALRGSSQDGGLPRIDSSPTRLDLRTRVTGVQFLGIGTRETWNVTLPQASLLDVSARVNAGTGTLNLNGAHLGVLDIQGNAGSLKVNLAAVAALREVSVQMNAGSARISLPASSLGGTLQVNAGSLGFCVPAGTGLRITSADNPTSSNNFGEQGLVRSGSTWESPGYGAASARITLSATANAGSITLNPKDGCE